MLKQIYCAFFSHCFKKFFSNSIINKKHQTKLQLVMPTGTSITVANKAIETPPVAADKANKILSTIKRCNIFT